MKRISMLVMSLFFLLMLVGGGVFAHAEGLKSFARIEYYTVGGAFDKYEDALKTDKSSLSESLDTVNSSNENQPGTGVTMGVRHPLGGLLSVGFSLGFIRGPQGTFHLSGVNSGTFDEVDFSQDLREDFVRVMAEVEKGVAVSKSAEIRIGGGLGIARGSAISRFDVILDGIGFVDPTRFSSTQGTSKTWTGLTYEIAPSLVLKGDRADFVISAAYSVFPKLKEDDNFIESNWKPFSVRVGVEF